MKKIMYFFLVVIICISGNIAKAGDNYLQVRYEQAGDKDSGENQKQVYTLFENSSIDDLALGFRFIKKDSGYQIAIPHIYYKVFENVHLGVRYASDSLDQESLGPTVRYMGLLGDSWFTILDATIYFDTKDDYDIADVYWSMSTASQRGWFYGFEAWYYSINKATENLKIRPLKAGYRFDNGVSPFIMIQRHWNNVGMTADTVMVGFEFNF